MGDVITMRLNQEVLNVIDSVDAKSRSEAVRELIADGLRWRMREYTDKPIDPHFTDPLNTDGVIQFYGEFIQAVKHDLGLSNPDGNNPRYHFCQLPTGGQWEQMGVTGWGVLPINARYTENGTEYPAKEDDNA